MKIKKSFFKMLATTALAGAMVASSVSFASAAWSYKNVDVNVGATLNFTKPGFFSAYKIDYSVSASGKEVETALDVKPVKYKIYEKKVNVPNNIIKEDQLSYKNRINSGSFKERGCDDYCAMKIEFDNQTKYLFRIITD